MQLGLVALLAAGCTGELSFEPGTSGDAASQPPPVDAAPPRRVDIAGPPVLPHVQGFADAVCGAVAACTISTYEGHHPNASRALDILISNAYGSVPTDDNALGDAVADFALAGLEEHGIWYVIFRQRINYGTGGGWEPMEDRGSITQNHYDHVHVSFEE
jgi:hypothetical protein